MDNVHNIKVYSKLIKIVYVEVDLLYVVTLCKSHNVLNLWDSVRFPKSTFDVYSSLYHSLLWHITFLVTHPVTLFTQEDTRIIVLPSKWWYTTLLEFYCGMESSVEKKGRYSTSLTFSTGSKQVENGQSTTCERC